jgi:hypothetical protein
LRLLAAAHAGDVAIHLAVDAMGPDGTRWGKRRAFF